jgi:FlaA1/EpsC-like NDP-sugar epimerase
MASSQVPFGGPDGELTQLKPGASPQPTHSTLSAAAVPALTRRFILVATTTTIRALIQQVRDDHTLRSPVGCFLVDRHDLEPGSFISGTQMLGGMRELVMLHQSLPFTMALVSITSGDRAHSQHVASQLSEMGIPMREVPPLSDIIAGRSAPVPVSSNVNLVELIGRTPYGIDRRAVARVVEGKRVLITGAGGSIGSEICRIVATFAPEELILVERSENALFEIDRQLARRFPLIKRRAVLHDVVDASGTLALMERTRPHAVFHAAAHKHVPLMEDHPGAAITNNVLGTKAVADAAAATGCDRFVMISSDKAVNPTSIMGATKRLAEMYVQGLGARTGHSTSMSMVRFGNVLGSACSVLPIWGTQLAEGGPLTVTDDRMTRYFMTINEAAALVIQASTIECRGGATPSIYVLDMGEPLRIIDLAERFARLSGYEPIRNTGTKPRQTAMPPIDLMLTGIRKGEKLHEELSYEAEALSPTAYPGINAFKASSAVTWDIDAMVDDLAKAAASGNHGLVVATIRSHVPEMKAPANAPLPADSPDDALNPNTIIGTVDESVSGSVRSLAA